MKDRDHAQWKHPLEPQATYQRDIFLLTNSHPKGKRSNGTLQSLGCQTPTPCTKTPVSWNTWVKIRLAGQLAWLLPQNKSQHAQKAAAEGVTDVCLLLAFSLWAGLQTKFIHSSLYWLAPTPFKISIFSLSLVQLLVQQSQPEVQEFKLLAVLFPSLATEYGEWDFSRCSPPQISLHMFISESDSNDERERTHPTLSLLSWFYMVNRNIKQ